MSLIQLWVEPDSVRIAVDTIGLEQVDPSNPRIHCSKILALPHAGMLMAYRGSNVAFLQIFGKTYFAPEAGDFDRALASLPERVSEATSVFPPGHPPAMYLCELIVAGYSNGSGRCMAAHFDVDLAVGKCQRHAFNGPARLAPGFHDVEALSDDGAMLRTARRQVDWMQANAPAQATGGRLLIGTATRHAVSIRDAGAI